MASIKGEWAFFWTKIPFWGPLKKVGNIFFFDSNFWIVLNRITVLKMLKTTKCLSPELMKAEGGKELMKVEGG